MESKAKRVLIVDDNLENIKVVANTLNANNIELAFAESGEEALKRLEKNHFDLILMDVMMPEMDGYETCEIVKNDVRYRDIPIIFLTAKVQTEEVVKGFQVGGVDYVTKPFIPEILLARVKTQLTLKDKTEKLRQLSDRDGLTEIANRRCFDNFLESEWRRSLRLGAPVSLIIADIDFFKLYNDCYGHLKGDDVLQKVAKIIENSARRVSDLAARYGGEEFAIVLGGTEADTALDIANSACHAIRELRIPHKDSKIENFVTASFGVGTIIPNQDFDKSELIKLADKQLYKAKNDGRNRVL